MSEDLQEQKVRATMRVLAEGCSRGGERILAEHIVGVIDEIDDESAGRELERMEADLLGIHDTLVDAGLGGALNAQSIIERIGQLLHAHHPQPGEILVDRQKAMNVVRANNDLHRALSSIGQLEGLADELQAVSDRAREALAHEPEFDALPSFVQVAGEAWPVQPPCSECHTPVDWIAALLVPSGPCGFAVRHRGGCSPPAVHS